LILLHKMIDEITVDILNNTFKLPKAMLDDNVFHHVISFKTFNSLPDSAKLKLQNLLPFAFDNNKDFDVLKRIFDPIGKCGFFGNPLSQFQKRLKDGNFDPEHRRYIQEINNCLRMNHDIKLQEHYCKLLKTLLVHRRQIFQIAKKCREDDPIKVDLCTNNSGPKRSKIYHRAMDRTMLVLKAIKAEVKETDLSSDDENIVGTINSEDIINQIINAKRQHLSHLDSNYSPDEPQFSTLYDPKLADFDMHQPTGPLDVKQMINEYNEIINSEHADHPSLDFSDITIEGVTERSGIVVAPTKPAVKKGHSVSLPNVLMPVSRT